MTIEGAGDHFSYGASVEEHRPDLIGRALPELHALVRDLLAVPAPTAAIVRGRCLGGGFEIALACDLLFASHDVGARRARDRAGRLSAGRGGAAAAAHRRVASRQRVLTGQARPVERWIEAGLVELIAPAAGARARRWTTGSTPTWHRDRLPRCAARSRAIRLSTCRQLEAVLPELERSTSTR